MGFGPACETGEQRITAWEKVFQNECRMDELYIDRVDRFYTLRHNKNCERTYLAVKRLPEEKQNRVGQFKIPPADAF